MPDTPYFALRQDTYGTDDRDAPGTPGRPSTRRPGGASSERSSDRGSDGLQDDLAGLYLPGWGSAHPGCGTVRSGVSCPEAGKAGRQATITGAPVAHLRRIIKAHCDRPECPTCWPTWADRQARRAAERLKAAVELMAKAGLRPGKLKHVVISPPQDWARQLILEGPEGARKLKAAATKILKAAGLQGGAVVFHPWRTTARGRGRYRKGQNYLSPHYHVIGHGFVMNAADFATKYPGWTYKNIGMRDEPAATVAYLLSHAGVRPGSHVLSWFGSMSYNKVVTDKEEKVEELVTCPCGQVCHEHNVSPRTGEIDWDRPAGPYYAQLRRRTYKLRDRPDRVTAQDALEEVLR